MQSIVQLRKVFKLFWLIANGCFTGCSKATLTSVNFSDEDVRQFTLVSIAFEHPVKHSISYRPE